MKRETPKELLRAAKWLLRKGPKLIHKDKDLDPTLKEDLLSNLDELRELYRKKRDFDKIEKKVKFLETRLHELYGYQRKSAVRESIEGFIWAIVIALLIRAFIIEAYAIPTGSMVPTLLIGDHLFVTKFNYGLRVPFTNYYLYRYATPKRGDIIVFKYPGHDEDQGKDFIKRVVGLPGDRIHLHNNILYINGKPVKNWVVKKHVPCNDEPPDVQIQCMCDVYKEKLGSVTHLIQHFTNDPYNCPVPQGDWPGPDKDFVVPEGRVFVMGDNRDNSKDSRYWGTLSLNNIEGRAFMLFWPPKRMFKLLY